MGPLRVEAGRKNALADWLRAESCAASLAIGTTRLLSGGAIQENWLVEVAADGGSLDGQHEFVLRTDAASGVKESRSRAEEFKLLRVAFAGGMTVPEPLLLCESGDVLGKPFYLMRRALGTANPRVLTRDAALDPHRPALMRQLGAEIARLHRVRPPRPDLPFLGEPPADAARKRIEEMLAFLDMVPEAHPILEWSLRWLERNRPAAVPAVLCHRDFRCGNYMVHDGKVTGVLDWEFAGWSDPLEDIGWHCARCWRFGADERPVGGVGMREDFYRGYADEAGHALDWSLVPYWEVMGTARWGVIALLQGERHNSGGEKSIELALTGRKAAEMELDLLTQIRAIEKGRA